MNNVIYVLPQFEDDGLLDTASVCEFVKHEKVRREIAKTIQYIPDTLETLKAIDYSDKRCLMQVNESFRAAALALCPNEINSLIELSKKVAIDLLADGEIDWAECVRVQKAETIDELLDSGYFGDDYESSLYEFLNVLVEDYLVDED